MADSIGLDLGSAAVDCAVVTKKGKLVQLKDYFSVKKEKAGPDQVADVMRIANEFQSRKMANAQVSISVTDKNFILITFKLPKLAPKEKEMAMRAEIEQKLPFPLEECAFDVIRLNEKEGPENNYVAFCTRIADVNRAHMAASNFNLNPAAIVTEMIANMNCASYNGYMEQKDISYLLLDVGGLHVGFTLVTNNLPWLTFSLAPKDTFNADETVLAFDPKNYIQEQIHEIGKVISSFEEKSVIAPIKTILLFGKAELVDLAAEQIASVTPLKMEKVDPLRKLDVPAKLRESLNPAFVSSVAVGLALSMVPGLEVAK